MRTGIHTKYARMGAVFAVLAFSIPEIRKYLLPERYAAWVPSLFTLFIVLAMVCFVAGMIADRQATNTKKP
jgi:hypothetical protein